MEYFEAVSNPHIVKYDANYKLSEFLLEDWVMEALPNLNESGKIYSIIDNKKLFDIGVDINTILAHKTMLQNMEFTPYNYPWWFSSLSLILSLIFVIIISIIACYCLKGHMACCTKKY